MSKNAAIYLRRSTDRQEQSIGDQRAAIERYTRENGFTVVREYLDDAISGADTEARKAFLQMIEDAKKRDAGFRYVLVYDISRFGRVGADEAGHYRHVLTQAGVEIIYIAEGLRGDQTDDLLVGVKQFIAHQTVVDLSKLTLRGQLSRVGKGRWCGGRPPYGYDLVHHDSSGRAYQIVRFLDSGDRQILTLDGSLNRTLPRGSALVVANSDYSRLVPGDPVRVAIVRQIFDWYVGGVGLAKIAERLNEERVPSAMGCRPGTRWKGTWSLGTIREFLLNRAYRGDTTWNRRTYAKFHRVEQGQAVTRPKVALGKVARNDPANWIVMPGTHEPIIAPDTFDTAQRLLKTRGGGIGDAVRASRRNSPYALGGLIRCARCGMRWQGYKTGKGRKKPGEKRIETYYYCCAGYVTKGNAVCGRALIPKDEFEDAVVTAAREHLHEFLTTGGSAVLEQLVLEVANPVGAEAHEKALRTRLADRERKLEELIGSITPALATVLEPRILALRDEIAGVEAELARVRQERLDADDARTLVADLVKDAGRIASLLETATTAETRDLLRAIVQEVVVNPDASEAEITLYAMPRLGGGGGSGASANHIAPNEERTRPGGNMSSHMFMAGARLVGPQRTFRVRVIRKPCLFRILHRVAG